MGDRWERLHELALGEVGSVNAQIEITEDPNTVFLHFPDGSFMANWNDLHWQWEITPIWQGHYV